MIQARLPVMANAVMEALEGNAQGCIGELQESTRVLDASGDQFAGRRSPSSYSRRAWRVATWLAILRVFFS